MPRLRQSLSTSTMDKPGQTTRRRVVKACDRCRVKKAKCDGLFPCSKCRESNSICGSDLTLRPNSSKPVPRGYAWRLEMQQTRLVTALQLMYRQLLAANLWPGEPLVEVNGQPLVHDILFTLNLLPPPYSSPQEGQKASKKECTEKREASVLPDVDRSSINDPSSRKSSLDDHESHLLASQHPAAHNVQSSCVSVSDDKPTFGVQEVALHSQSPETASPALLQKQPGSDLVAQKYHVEMSYHHYTAMMNQSGYLETVLQSTQTNMMWDAMQLDDCNQIQPQFLPPIVDDDWSMIADNNYATQLPAYDCTQVSGYSYTQLPLE